MNRRPATAKLNLALVVGPAREDGKHEVTTILQRVDLADRVAVEPARRLEVDGFADDTIVRRALERLGEEAGVEPVWRARIWKKIPVAAGLGGGSSDAATALRLANGLLAEPLPAARLLPLAAELGADVPFFLADGPQLGRGDGSELTRLELPQDYWIVLLQPHGETKPSTAAIYERLLEYGYDAAIRAKRHREQLATALAYSRDPEQRRIGPDLQRAAAPFGAQHQA